MDSFNFTSCKLYLDVHAACHDDEGALCEAVEADLAGALLPTRRVRVDPPRRLVKSLSYLPGGRFNRHFGDVPKSDPNHVWSFETCLKL